MVESYKILGIPPAHEPLMGEHRIPTGENSGLVVTWGGALPEKGDVLKIEIVQFIDDSTELRQTLWPTGLD